MKPYYQKDGQTIYNGDCLEIMKTFADKSFDLVLTDPPYGVTSQEWDNDEVGWMKEAIRLVKDKGAVVSFATQPFTTKLINEYKTFFKYCWIWDKGVSGSFLLAAHQPLKITEDICVFSRGTHNYYPIMKKGRLRDKGSNTKNNHYSLEYKKKINDDYFPTNIIKISNANKHGVVHPTQKPLELIKYLIATYSKEGDTILDPFGGSGTTAVAAKYLNRNCTLIEISEKYCEIAKNRLAQGSLF